MRLTASAFTLALLTASVAAQTVRLRDVIARLDSYLLIFEERLANVVAEEAYRQWVEEGPWRVPHGRRRSRWPSGLAYGVS